MNTITITLSDAELKALNYVASSAQEWAENAVKERCRISIEDIVSQEVQRKLALGETISGTKDDIVLAAPIKSALDRKADEDAKMAELASK